LKFISYHILKVTKKIRIIISNYHSKSNIPKKNIEFKNIINKNRDTLKKYSVLIREDQFKKNNYGMSNEIFQKMNFTINESPTYTDLIIFLSRFLEKVNINYLEIGVSVLKNYIQIINSLRNANIIAYDINPVNPNFDYLYNKEEKKMKMGTFEDNQIYYFEGSVTEENDFKLFKDHINKKFNIIFSDAMHTPEGIRSEFDNLIKDNLDDRFILYYDDLDFKGLEEEVSKIYKEINVSQKCNFYTFYINGWVGQYEIMHKNGVITNLDLSKIFKDERLNLRKFNKI